MATHRPLRVHDGTDWVYVGDPRASTFAKIGADPDTTPTIHTADEIVRVLTPEAAAEGYAPRGEGFFIPAKAFDSRGTGNPEYVPQGDVWGWALDDGSTAAGEGVVAVFMVPPHWSAMQVEVWWFTPSGGTDVVDWYIQSHNLTHGNTTVSGYGGRADTPAAVTGPDAGRVRVTLAADPLTVDPAAMVRLTIVRNTYGSGEDTHTGDIGLLGARIKRAA